MTLEVWLYLTLVSAACAHVVGWALLFVFLSVKDRRDQRRRNRQIADVFREADKATREVDDCIMAIIDKRMP